MTLRSRLDLTQLAAPGADTGNVALASAWGWTDPQTNKEYALVARRSDLAIVDISDPDVPVLVGNVQRTAGTNPTTWRDVRVIGDWAYIGVDAANHGIQAFDLRRVRGVSAPTLFTADATYMGVSNSHSLGVNLDTSTPFLFAAGANTINDIPEAPDTVGGLQILNVSNPLAISTAASWQSDNYIHETVIFSYNGPDTEHVGKQLAFNSNATASTNSFSILDATNMASLVRISQATYPQTGYNHQGYLTEDHRFLLMNDELDETNLGLTQTRTHVFDVTDLDNPVYKGFAEWGNGSIDHNFYIAGDFIYQANYTRGIRIHKIGDLDSADPEDWIDFDIAWLDTYPANDGQSFNGAWQVYPYFASGNIIVSDINGGLFIVNHVPEPAGLGLVTLAGLALLRRRRPGDSAQPV
jgi:choice-of-anchor B domain-containing protein